MTLTTPKLRRLHATLGELGIKPREDRLRALTAILGRDVATSGTLTEPEYARVLKELDVARNWPEEHRVAQVAVWTAAVTDPWKDAA